MSIAHIETSRALRLVDKSFPDLVDWNYKTLHERSINASIAATVETYTKAIALNSVTYRDSSNGRF